MTPLTQKQCSMSGTTACNIKYLYTLHIIGSVHCTYRANWPIRYTHTATMQSLV